MQVGNDTTTTTSIDGGDPLVAFDLSDPWTIAAIVLMSLVVLVGTYRASRVFCVCRIDQNE